MKATISRVDVPVASSQANAKGKFLDSDGFVKTFSASYGIHNSKEG